MSRDLLIRCLEPLQENLDDLKNERAKYDGWPARQSRYDALIEEREVLLAEVKASTAEPQSEGGKP